MWPTAARAFRASCAASLFRPFERGGGDGPAGLGLGLTLARALARAMDGDLVHTERDGGGAVFSLRLPPSRQTQT